MASIKENKTNDGIVSIQTQKGRYIARGFTLAALIRNAYRVQEFQIIGGARILDRTGLEGAYNVTLKFTPDNIPPVNQVWVAWVAWVVWVAWALTQATWLPSNPAT